MAAATILLGDSQGEVLAGRLRACAPGLVVGVKSGRPIAQVLAAAKALPAATRSSATHVWVTGGGNDGASPNTAAARELVDLFPAGVVVWVAPPPAATIANLAHAKAVFGSNVKTANHWFTNGTAASRETCAAKLRQAVDGYHGARWLDVRQLVQPYPAQPDGIHMAGATADKVAAALCAGESRSWASSWVPWAALGGLALIAVAAWRVHRRGIS
jgi:lysophospholipase L1-like esterase